MAKKKPTQASKNTDDLKKIEGIGPKIEELLRQQGIDSFSKLADKSTKQLREILDKAGTRFRAHDPTTWTQQSALAAKGKWDELKALQKKLIGGRELAPQIERPKAVEPSVTVALSAIGGGTYDPSKPFVIERILNPDEVALEYEFRKKELDEQYVKAELCAEALWNLLKERKEFRDHITGVSDGYRTFRSRTGISKIGSGFYFI